MENYKYCIKCGKKLALDADFCQFCGSKQSSADEISESVVTYDSSDQKSVEQQMISKKQTHLDKYKWVYGLLILILCTIVFLRLRTPNPSYVASDIEDTLNSDNTLDVSSVKADNGTFVVHIKNNEAVYKLYMGNTANFKSVQRTMIDLSKKYKGKKKNNIDYSYIQILKPGSNDRILMSVDNGKIKYSAVDEVE
ncbi:hypothetical protein ACPBEI_08190 [Latilactobacillus sakei]